MSVSLQRLLLLFERERAQGHAMVLATVVHTAGPTYTKPGAHMLIARSGEYAGLLSGGCLEGDLSEHGRAVLESGTARLVRYDMQGPDDLLFGLGSGCEGAMDILLQRLDPGNDWQPMNRLAAAWRALRAEALLLVLRCDEAALPIGAAIFAEDGQVAGVPAHGAAAARSMLHRLIGLAAQLPLDGATRYLAQALPGVDLLALVQTPPPRLLLLGAGVDAQPVGELAAFLGWHLTVLDHRPHYAQRERFPLAAAVLGGGPAALPALLDAQPYAAAVVMSHHFGSDLAYLRALERSAIGYIGLLGPAVRRERLLAELGADVGALRARLRSPVGLDLGATTPEAIALAIVAEIHATLAGRTEPGSRSLKAAS